MKSWLIFRLFSRPGVPIGLLPSGMEPHESPGVDQILVYSARSVGGPSNQAFLVRVAHRVVHLVRFFALGDGVVGGCPFPIPGKHKIKCLKSRWLQKAEKTLWIYESTFFLTGLPNSLGFPWCATNLIWFNIFGGTSSKKYSYDLGTYISQPPKLWQNY